MFHAFFVETIFSCSQASNSSSYTIQKILKLSSVEPILRQIPTLFKEQTHSPSKMPKDFDPKHPKRKTPYSKPKPKSSQSQEREEKQYPSVNDLKRRIRDVKRLLAKTDLPADKRIIQERALSGYEKELADEERRRERSRMIKKYHFVRFLGKKFPTFSFFLSFFLFFFFFLK